jgi:hypothetical protein
MNRPIRTNAKIRNFMTCKSIQTINFFIILFLTSCSSVHDDKYFPICIGAANRDCKLLNTNGANLKQFDSSEIIEDSGQFILRSGHPSTSLVSRDGKILIPDGILNYIGNAGDNLWRPARGIDSDFFGWVNENGEWMIRPDNLNYSFASPFFEGLAAVEIIDFNTLLSHRYGYINTAGKIIIPFNILGEAKNFKNKRAVISQPIQDKKNQIIYYLEGLIDQDGNKIITEGAQSINWFAPNRWLIDKLSTFDGPTEKFQIVDENGRILLETSNPDFSPIYLGDDRVIINPTELETKIEHKNFFWIVELNSGKKIKQFEEIPKVKSSPTPGIPVPLGDGKIYYLSPDGYLTRPEGFSHAFPFIKERAIAYNNNEDVMLLSLTGVIIPIGLYELEYPAIDHPLQKNEIPIVKKKLINEDSKNKNLEFHWLNTDAKPLAKLMINKCNYSILKNSKDEIVWEDGDKNLVCQ